VKRLIAVLLLASGQLLVGCGETSTDGPTLYARMCASCHSRDLSGGVGPALGRGSEAATQTESELLTVIQFGTRGMPSASGLSDEQLDAIVAYLRQEQAG
jgi:mono/diheme cytochrome c family protein